MKKTITNQEVASLSNASVYPFPKYTTMLINQINQTAQGTRPKVVGQMSELIKEFDGQTLDECGENGGYPPTKNGDIRSFLCA